MNLNNLKPAEGSTKNRKRIGRGTGSGRGGTSTKVGFEGGQMPLQRRVPKVGFKNPNRVEYVSVNLDALQSLVDEHQVSVIDFETLKQHGLVSRNDLVKVLGRGELKAKLEVTAHAFSATAQKAIEAAGGSIVKL